MTNKENENLKDTKLEKELIDDHEISDDTYDDMIYKLEKLKNDMEQVLDSLRSEFMVDIEQMAKKELKSFQVDYNEEEHDIQIDLESKSINIYKKNN